MLTWLIVLEWRAPATASALHYNHDAAGRIPDAGRHTHQTPLETKQCAGASGGKRWRSGEGVARDDDEYTLTQTEKWVIVRRADDNTCSCCAPSQASRASQHQHQSACGKSRQVRIGRIGLLLTCLHPPLAPWQVPRCARHRHACRGAVRTLPRG